MRRALVGRFEQSIQSLRHNAAARIAQLRARTRGSPCQTGLLQKKEVALVQREPATERAPSGGLINKEEVSAQRRFDDRADFIPASATAS